MPKRLPFWGLSIAPFVLLLFLSGCNPAPEPLPTRSESASPKKETTHVPTEPLSAALDVVADTVRRASFGQSRPACLPWVDGRGQLVVGETRLSILEQSDPRPELRVFPLDKEAVQLSFWQGGETTLQETLWQVSCFEPTALLEKVLHVEGADFFHASLDPSGGLLYFGGRPGLSVWDRRTSETQRLDVAPVRHTPLACDGVVGRDRVLSTQGTRVSFTRERQCPSGDWSGVELALDVTSGRVHQPHPVKSLALSGAGSLYLAEGGRCDVPGIRDPATPGVIFVSTNMGQSWQALSVKTAEGAMTTPAAEVFADPREPGVLVVQAKRCRQLPGQFEGGEIYATQDGGVHWRRVPLPETVSAEALRGVERLKGATHLRLRVGSSWQREIWETSDGGASWQRGGSVSMPVSSRTVRHRGAIFQTSRDGVIRFQGRQQELVFPGENSRM